MNWLADKIEQWPTAKLLPYARNARTHSDEQVAQIAASIAEFGFTNPILAGSDGIIVAGHGRLAAAQKLGLERVPVVVLDHLSATQRRALVIADNRIAENAGWDDELLAIEFAELADAGFDNLLTGFTQDEIDALTPEQIPEGLTDEDAVPEVQAEPVSKLGDVWLLGKHRVMCGDSTDAGSVALLMNGKSADVTFTSPPYNANTKAGDGDIFTSKKSKKLYTDGYSDNLQSDAYVEFASKVLDTCFEVTSGFIFWNVSYNANSRFEYIKQIVPRLEFLIEQICWKKSSSIPFKGSLMRDWEPIYLFSTNGERLGLNEVVSNHWTVSNTNSQTETHKACFPVELPSKGISLIKPKTNIVFDPFGGSGTTMIACEKHGRHARLMELDPRYCDVIVKRWQEFTGKQATLEATGATFAEVEADSGLAVAEDV